MRVGILTFHAVLNYGAMLQAYALSETITDLGHSCEIIDYRTKFFDEQYKPIHMKNIRHPRVLFSEFRMKNAVMKLSHEKDDFVTNIMKTSTRTYDRSNIAQCVDDYDVIIAGSDQVWNMKINGNDSTYFLDFVNDDRKCASYAASVSMKTFDDQNKEFIKKLLSRFSFLSVRETDAKVLVEELTGKDVYVNIDPTLLMARDKWLDFSQNTNADDYILLYMMTIDEKLCKYAMELSRKKGIPVKYISLYEPSRKGFEIVFAPSVVEWVNYFRNAKYVVTNSFHGMVFSIIFHRQFAYGLNKNAGKNTRLNSLLSQLGIGDRVADISIPDKIDDYIEYENVEKSLERLRKDSIDYLKLVLSEGEREKI